MRRRRSMAGQHSGRLLQPRQADQVQGRDVQLYLVGVGDLVGVGGLRPSLRALRQVPQLGDTQVHGTHAVVVVVVVGDAVSLLVHLGQLSRRRGGLNTEIKGHNGAKVDPLGRLDLISLDMGNFHYNLLLIV